MSSVFPDADANDVMREQLEYLIDHAAGRMAICCSLCRRYLRARSVLLEIFSPATGTVTEFSRPVEQSGRSFAAGIPVQEDPRA
jgi:hypothetical protein